MTSLDFIFSHLCDILESKGEIEIISNLFSKVLVQEKVSFTYDLLWEESLLPEFVENTVKSASKALEFRNLGNKAFGLKKDIEALKHYIESIAVSPNNSKELALAYANRSAVLFKLNKFNLCLLDINRALSKNYPDSLKNKLHARKRNCISKIKASQDFQQNILDKFSELVVEDDVENLPTEINQVRNRLSNELGMKENETEINNDFRFIIPQLPSRNKLVRSASEKIKLNFSFEMGRHIVASQDIEPGEILAVEKPYASILLPDFYHTHCSHCFIRNEAMIPCNNCSMVMFCGNRCLDASLKLFHKIECPILPRLVSLKCSVFELLALRVLLIATEQGQKLKNLIEHPLYKYPIAGKCLSLNEEYISEHYNTVHNLEDNFMERPVADQFRRSAASAILLHVLKQSPFFHVVRSPKIKSNKLSTYELFAGVLLLKYLMAALSNAHEISELIQNKSSSPDFKFETESLEIGSALYPLLSFTNHSCDPNVVRHNYRDGIVLRSIQFIKTDDQIFDNYGYHYAIHSLEKRKTHLTMQYFFECKCDPCKYNWPLYKELPSTDPEYLSENVDRTALKQSSKMFYSELKKTRLNTEGLLNSICEHLSLLHKSIKRPWQEYCECQEFIKEVLAYRANFYSYSSDIILYK